MLLQVVEFTISISYGYKEVLGKGIRKIYIFVDGLRWITRVTGCAFLKIINALIANLVSAIELSANLPPR